MGWDWFQSPAPRGDPGSGVAVAIRKDRSDVVVSRVLVGTYPGEVDCS